MRKTLIVALLAALAVGAGSCAGGGGGPQGCALKSVTPSVGDPLGGETVTLSGRGFKTGMLVVFGTRLGSFVIVNSSTSATVATPPGPALGVPVDVTVIDPKGNFCPLPDAFTYTGSCATEACGCILAGVLPAQGPVEGGATVQILGGAGFLAGASVAFGTEFSPQVTWIASNELIAVTPPSAIEGPVDVTVLNPSGTVCRIPDGYTYGPGCALISVSPSTACIFVANPITITGHGFQPGAIVKYLFNGMETGRSPEVIVVDESTIQAFTNIGIFATVDVEVENPDGTTCILPQSLTYFINQPPIPTCDLSMMSPNTGPLGGATMVTITGSGFDSTDRVLFGYRDGLMVSVISPNEIRVLSPPAFQPGPVAVRVVDAACTRVCFGAVAIFRYQ